MVARSYEAVLQMAELLNRDEQLRLIEELKPRAGQEPSPTSRTSVLELCGLGEEIWRKMDAQEYVHRERSSWNG